MAAYGSAQTCSEIGYDGWRAGAWQWSAQFYIALAGTLATVVATACLTGGARRTAFFSAVLATLAWGGWVALIASR